MQRTAVIVLALLAIACGGSKEMVSTTVQERPAWVQSRPISSLDYIGIGVASKSSTDFMEVAKKNALNDLASEIKVNVSGNSFLHTLEREYEFQEEFSGAIRTTTDEDLEGYKLQGTYDGSDGYWVYYRLSKAEHARIQKEKRTKAQGLAMDLHAKAQAALAENDLQSNLNLQIKALLSLKEFWGEENKVQLDGREVFLENEIFNALQRVTGGLRLNATPDPIVLDHGNHYRVELEISVKDGANGAGVGQVPLQLEYKGVHRKVKHQRRTGTNGTLEYVLSDVAYSSNAGDLFIRVDLDEMLESESDGELGEAILHSLPSNELRVPIRVRLPLLYLKADEKNLGEDLSTATLATNLKGELTKEGFEFTNDPSKADIHLTLKADTRKGGESNGFHISYLDLELSAKDRHNGLIIHEGGQQGLKGVQLDYPKAGLDAYKKASDKLERSLVKELIAAML